MTDLETLLDGWGGDLTTFRHAARWGFDLEAIAYRLRTDPQFALELRYCNDHGLPHHRFLDEWSPEDQAKALGSYLHEQQRCGECGIHPEDWPDPDEPTYQVEVRKCPGCELFARWQRWAQEQAEGNNAKDAMDGVKPYLKRRGDG